MSEQRIDKVEAELSDLKVRINAVETNHAIASVESNNIDKRLGSIEDTLKWLVRLILGALILALIAFIIGGGIA